jgi:hypothetical protein
VNGRAEPIRGSCLCGGVAFVIRAPLLSMGNCHCSMCRRQHGTAYSTYAQARAADVEITRGAELVRSYASSPGAERRFCATCGAKLFYAAHAMPEYLWVAAGALDDDPGIAIGQHIFVASKAPWFEITDDLPQHDGFPAGEGH